MSPRKYWVLRLVLRKILRIIRRSIQSSYLWSVLSRRIQSLRPASDVNSSPPAGSSTAELPADDSIKNNIICPNMQPRSRSPNMLDVPDVTGPSTLPAASSSMLHAYPPYTQRLGTMSSVGGAPGDNASVSSRRSGISAAPPSVTRRSRHSSLLRPYSHGASRSSQSLAGASKSNYSLNNFSTTSHHRPPSSRAPSHAQSAGRSSETGSYHFSIEPESTFSNHPDASVGDFPNVATPAGDVASRSNYSLNNLSTTSHHRPPSSRAPSLVRSSASETGSARISIEPETPSSNHSDASIENFHEVATPVGPAGKLYQTAPEWIKRYDRDIHIQTESAYKVQPLQFIFPHDDQPLPSGWTPLTHPEGALYFYHTDRKIYTDAYLYDQDMLLHTTTFIQRIDEVMLARSFEIDADLVLEVTPDDDEKGKIRCGYYFVHHQTRSLFWLEEFEVDGLVYEIKGFPSDDHLKHEIESQYWKHWELFPNNYAVSQDIIDELSETLLYASGDCLTSPVSTAPYSSDNLNKMLRLVKQVKPGKWHGHSACYIGRLMSTFAHQKFLHFHGQNGARLCRNQSLFKNVPHKRSLLITVLSPILFNAPDVHLRDLGDIWVDDIIGHVPWTKFVTKLSDEWKEFTLYGTVLLNANVAFLAIQSVDTNVPASHRSGAQLSSYVSVVVSVGSIILGLLLERQSRTKDRESAQAASSFLSRMTHPSRGLETLAIMYSLPYALLMWGMLSFLAALCFVCFDNTSLYSRAIVGATSVAISVLIFWSVWTAWESDEDCGLALLSRIFRLLASHARDMTRQLGLPTLSSMFVRRSQAETIEMEMLPVQAQV